LDRPRLLRCARKALGLNDFRHRESSRSRKNLGVDATTLEASATLVELDLPTKVGAMFAEVGSETNLRNWLFDPAFSEPAR
jgi:hypothetical protein